MILCEYVAVAHTPHFVRCHFTIAVVMLFFCLFVFNSKPFFHASNSRINRESLLLFSNCVVFFSTDDSFITNCMRHLWPSEMGKALCACRGTRSNAAPFRFHSNTITFTAIKINIFTIQTI